MSSPKLVFINQKERLQHYCKETDCSMVAMLVKEKEERAAENEKLRKIFNFVASKLEQKKKEITNLHN